MIRINNDYLIDCDGLQYILKIDRHRKKERKGIESMVTDTIGYYGTLEGALEGYTDYMTRKRHAAAEMSIKDALTVIREERRNLENLIERYTEAEP